VDNTKTRGVLMDWTELGISGSGETPLIKSPDYNSGEALDSSLHAKLNIKMVHADANDAGTDFAHMVIQTNTTGDAEGWCDFTSPFRATGGQANGQILNAASGVSQAEKNEIHVAATANFDTPGGKYFLKDVNTLVDSTIIRNAGFVTDTHVVHVDNLIRDYDTADYLYDIVDEWSIELPPGTQQARVVFYNTDTGATYACFVDYEMVTDLE